MAAWDLCASSDVKTALEITSTTRDTLIAEYISDASREIMRICEREFAPATASELRRIKVDPRERVEGCVYIDFAPYDLRSVSTFTLHPEASGDSETLTENTHYTLMPVRAVASPTDSAFGVYTRIRFDVNQTFSSTFFRRFGYCLADITGAWGFASVPRDVKDAAVLTVTSWLRRDFPAFAQGGFDSEPATLAPERQGTYSIPRAAIRKLQPFKRNGGAF